MLLTGSYLFHICIMLFLESELFNVIQCLNLIEKENAGTLPNHHTCRPVSLSFQDPYARNFICNNIQRFYD